MTSFLSDLVAHRGCLILDGPTGTELVARGYVAHPVLWTAEAALTQPELLLGIHRDYLAAGADILTANTFRTSSHAVQTAGLPVRHAELLTAASVALCQKARDAGGGAGLVAGSLAPLADCYHPERVPADAVLARVHAQTAAWLGAAGCDLILAETMGTEREAVSAASAARETGIAAVLISFITDPSGTRLLGGEPLLPAARAVLSAGAHGVLINCVHAEVLERALVQLQPLRRQDPNLLLGGYANAARMRLFNGEPFWDAEPGTLGEQAASYAQRARVFFSELGARILGSCCGTGPLHIRCLRQALTPAG